MSMSRFRWLQSSFSECYEQASHWAAKNITPTVNSKPMLLFRGSVHGAVKAAYTSHLLFDLGLSLIPLTSPWFNTLRIAKYTVTGITFVISSSTAYYFRKHQASKKELVNQIEQKFNQVDAALDEVENMFEEQEHLLKRLGFTFQEEKPGIPGIPLEESQPEAKSECKQCEESIVGRGLKAVLSGAINGTGIQYIFNKATEIALSGPSTAYSVVSNIASWSTAIGTTARSYSQSLSELEHEARIDRIAARLSIANQKIQVLKKMLGSRQDLIKVAEYGAQITQTPVWFEIETQNQAMNPLQRNGFQFFKCFQSSEFKKARSGTDGLYIAGSVQNMCGILLPSWVAIQYIAALLMLGMGSKRSYDNRKKSDYFIEKIQDLNVKVADIFEHLDVARVVMRQQREYVDALLGERSGNNGGIKDILVIPVQDESPALSPYSELKDPSNEQQVESDENKMLDEADLLFPSSFPNSDDDSDDEAKTLLEDMEEGKASRLKPDAAMPTVVSTHTTLQTVDLHKMKLFKGQSKSPDKQPLLSTQQYPSYST